MSQSVYEVQMAQLLKDNGYEFVREYRFDKKRRFRFDFSLILPKTKIRPAGKKIAIEVEGGQWIKGKHNWGNSFTKDCEKYNLAQMNGWIVLRYTPDNLTQVIEDLKNL